MNVPHALTLAAYLTRALTLALLVALVGGCDIFREEFYQRTGKSEGTLVANIGMPLEEVERRSTLKLSAGFHAPSGETEKSAQAVFDLELSGTGVRLERGQCVYPNVNGTGVELIGGPL